MNPALRRTVLLCCVLMWNDSVGLGRGVSRCREWVRAVWYGAVAGLELVTCARRRSCHVVCGSVAKEPEETRGVLRLFLESNLESIFKFWFVV